MLGGGETEFLDTLEYECGAPNIAFFNNFLCAAWWNNCDGIMLRTAFFNLGFLMDDFQLQAEPEELFALATKYHSRFAPNHTSDLRIKDNSTH